MLATALHELQSVVIYPDLIAPSSTIVILLLQDLSWLWWGSQGGLSLSLQTLKWLTNSTNTQ